MKQLEEADSRDEILAIFVVVRHQTGKLERSAVLPEVGEGPSPKRAAAFLTCVAHGWDLEFELIDGALRSECRELMVAAAYCLAFTRTGAEEGVRELLSSVVTPIRPRLTADGSYFLVKALGLSENLRFVPVLVDSFMTNYHYLPRPHVRKALARLGGGVGDKNEDEFPFDLSVVVRQSQGGPQILLDTDEKYRGGSVCIQCRFFGCKINRYFAGGIEDCELWNRTDPETLGELVDRRNFGVRKEVIPRTDPHEHELLRSATELIAGGEPCAAVPILCSILAESRLKSGLSALVWVNVARCFYAVDEPLLAFIAMREAARVGNLIGESAVLEREALEQFIDDPEGVLGRPLPPENRWHRLGLRAIGYKQCGLTTQALDCHLEENICDRGDHGGSWFEMGECHLVLGECHLAELWMMVGAAKAGEKWMAVDPTLVRRFLGGADLAKGLRSPGSGIGLALARRAAERAEPDPPYLCRV